MTTAILVSAIGYAISAVISFIACKIDSILGTADISAILIPYDELALIPSLASVDTALICLDTEIDGSLDSDDKAAPSTGNLLSSRKVYLQCKTILDELIDIHKKTSKAVSKFVFFSCDYHLLKSGNAGKIIYTLPSEAYHQELMKRDAWDEPRYQKIKAELQARKSDKITVYNSFGELQQLLLKKYNFNLKY